MFKIEESGQVKLAVIGIRMAVSQIKPCSTYG